MNKKTKIEMRKGNDVWFGDVVPGRGKVIFKEPKNDDDYYPDGYYAITFEDGTGCILTKECEVGVIVKCD